MPCVQDTGVCWLPCGQIRLSVGVSPDQEDTKLPRLDGLPEVASSKVKYGSSGCSNGRARCSTADRRHEQLPECRMALLCHEAAHTRRRVRGHNVGDAAMQADAGCTVLSQP
jgi:hypothetical protein